MLKTKGTKCAFFPKKLLILGQQNGVGSTNIFMTSPKAAFMVPLHWSHLWTPWGPFKLHIHRLLPGIAVSLRQLEWSVCFLPGHQNSFLGPTCLHPGPTPCLDLADDLLCLALLMDPTTSPAASVTPFPRGLCHWGGHIPPGAISAPESTPLAGSLAPAAPWHREQNIMNAFMSGDYHTQHQHCLNYRSFLQRKEKYLAKLCNQSSKIAYCHLAVLFRRPKNPQVFLKLAILFANSAKFFTKSWISHAWITSGVFLNQLCSCRSCTQSYSFVPCLPCIF